MKTLIWEYIKTTLFLAGIEILLFAMMIFFVMTDESVGIIGKVLSGIVKYIMSFPLIIINRDYPFFINNSNPPNYMLVLIILNLLLQSGIIFLIKRLLK